MNGDDDLDGPRLEAADRTDHEALGFGTSDHDTSLPSTRTSPTSSSMALSTSSWMGSTTSTAMRTRLRKPRCEVRGQLDVVAGRHRRPRQAVGIGGSAVTGATVPAVRRAIAWSLVPEAPDRRSLRRVGIGNALVDVIAHADEDFLGDHGLVKGSMALIDIDRARHLYQALGSAVEMSGGSAANTMCGLSSFGGRAAYLGKVSDDSLGEVFAHDLNAVGVAFQAGAPLDDTPTGAVRHRRHTGRPAHDEHLPGCRRVPLRR